MRMDYLHIDEHQRRDGVLEVQLVGELVLCSGVTVEIRLGEIIDRPDTRHVVVDLRQLGFCDAGGLNVLEAVQRYAAKQHKTVVFARPRGIVQRLFDLAEFDRHIIQAAAGGYDDWDTPSGGRDMSESP
jgi:anti-anti-sigma factor